MSVMDKGEAGVDGTIVIEFDGDNALHYMYCQACCLLPLATSCLILPCLPCLPYCQRKEFESQKCKITDKRIEFEGGWMNHIAKNVPLDRVQDVSISQGCVQRCFGVKSLGVQTAGGGSAEGAVAEVSLLAPKNAEMIRDVILQRRDYFVLGPGNGMAAGGGIDDITKNKPSTSTTGAWTAARGTTAEGNAQLVLEIRELKETVTRMEKHMLDGLAKMDETRL